MKQVILVNCLLLVTILTSIAQKIEKKYINPGPGYTQVVTATANGVKTIYVSGQVGEGKNLEEQTRSALLNVRNNWSRPGHPLPMW